MIGKILKKLRARSLTELKLRGTQALAAQSERSGLSRQTRVPNDAAFLRLLDPTLFSDVASLPEDLLRHFRTRAVPNFFAAFAEPGSTREELRRRFGAAAERSCIEKAERILEGKFDLLGFHDLSFGSPMDWHLEPLAGKQTPRTHWSRVDYLNPAAAGDKKIIWELNRHQYWMTLGRAYWFTGDARYAEAFVAHADAWMDANPPKSGINWTSNLEVAFRCIAWIWALQFFKDAECVTPQFFLRLLKTLYLQGRHLETYLSTYFSPNTHLTGEALGLYYLGKCLPELRPAGRWREQGRHILLSELERQIRSDGVYFEQTTYYHRYTTDFYLHFYLLSGAKGSADAPLLAEKITALLDHLMHITLPDGTTPFLGDDDGGRLVMLDERPVEDFRAALATGAALFGRSDYKYVSAELAEETLWLLGSEGVKAFDTLVARPPEATSKAFPAGGYYVQRDGWTRESNCLLLDCGPHGALSYGHSHADALSFVLSAGGRTLLVDSGTATYTGSPAVRDRYRGAAAHNTLTVDGASSSEPATAFRWNHVAQSRLLDWCTQARFDFFKGEHDGYARLDAPAHHTRSLIFVKGDYWVIRDRIHTGESHTFGLHFHFAPGTSPQLRTGPEGAHLVERHEDKPGLELFSFIDGGATSELRTGEISPAYGVTVAAPVLDVTWRGKGAQDGITFLVPRSPDSSPVKIDALDTQSGRAFEIHLDGFHDWLLLANDTSAANGARDTQGDFEWAWVRKAKEGERPAEMVLYQGRRFCFLGKLLFEAREDVRFFVARWEGDTLTIDTDAQPGFKMDMFGASKVLINLVETSPETIQRP